MKQYSYMVTIETRTTVTIETKNHGNQRQGQCNVEMMKLRVEVKLIIKFIKLNEMLKMRTLRVLNVEMMKNKENEVD